MRPVVDHPSQTCLSQFMTMCIVMVIGVVSGMIFFGFESVPEQDVRLDQQQMVKYSNAHRNTNRTVAQHMRTKNRILCWILTGPTNHRTKAQHVRHTWGRHCNTLLFMSSAEDMELPNSIPLPVEEGRANLWAKTKEAFKYIYDNHRNDADWFLKADDDTFVVMENLRLLLHQYPSEVPIYFGRKFRYHEDIYMSGGAGYVLSKKAMTLLVETGINNASICYEGLDHPEDLEMGRCLSGLGVVAGDSRHANGTERFFPFDLNYHLALPSEPDKSMWYFTYSYYYPIDGKGAVPPNAISFHYVTPKWMYMYYYLIYTIRRYGRAPLTELIDERKFSLDEVKENLIQLKRNT